MLFYVALARDSFNGRGQGADSLDMRGNRDSKCGFAFTTPYTHRSEDLWTNQRKTILTRGPPKSSWKTHIRKNYAQVSNFFFALK